MNNYVELANYTKSPNYYLSKLDELRENILVEPVSEVFNEFIDLSNVADAMKKALFYGKVLDTLPGAKVNMNLATIDPDLLHGVLGIFSEAGELLIAIAESEVDPVNIEEEIGDVLWYIAILLKRIGVTDINRPMVKNIAKLSKRYPDKFSALHAVERDLEAERAVLES